MSMESCPHDSLPKQLPSDVDMIRKHDKTDPPVSKQSKSSEKCGSDRERLEIGISSGGGGDLNVERILTLLQGKQEHLNYFIGLWNELNGKKTINDVGDGCPVTWSCDLRDEEKMCRVKDWKPTIRVCPVGFGASAEEGSGCRVSQVDRDDDGDCGSVDGVGSGCYVVRQTVLDDEINGRQCGGKTDETTTMKPEIESDVMKNFPCGVYGCGQVLTSLANYESHYHHCHNYVCDTCRRVFVSNFLLDIHLQESHDSYFDILKDRIDMYRCLVESCQDKFRTPELRKDHLVRIHKFPSSFSFHQPIKSNRSKLTHNNLRPLTIEESSSAMDVASNVNNPDMAMDTESTPGLGTATGQKKKVPTSVCFGRGSQRAFQHRRGRRGGNKSRNWFQQMRSGSDGGNGLNTSDTTVDIQCVDMKDLADALD